MQQNALYTPPFGCLCPSHFPIRQLLLILVILAGATEALGLDTSYVVHQKIPGAFTLSIAARSAPIHASSLDFPGVIRAAKDLQADVGRATSASPLLSIDSLPASEEIVLVGTLGRSPLIDRLAAEKILDVKGLQGHWETYVIQVIEKPLPGVDRALVIAGSDKRGTIYGIYDLSSQIGVSPWYWWADVPVRRQSALFVIPGRHTDGEPAVRYRGIFINDEAPALAGWAREKFGGFDHVFYEKVFELILRLKGNYLWPAMWGNAFYADDPMNPVLADDYGVVIGTSHHEPMMRAHAEWGRGPGTWNYSTNREALEKFWSDGIRRMGSNESIVTVGMRGDGDEPMANEANIDLLERIVARQRAIITEVTGRRPESVPQVWALYKEVQEYYDKGMRVPDDVTLLLCDDNWGNIRRLPQAGDKPRGGGYGIYYHYDYVGGPRNYKWLNTNQISRVWEQMHLAYGYGVNRIWIVNVGDIKPMELPIDFFLDYAWNPDRWTADRLPEFTRRWAEKQFGPSHAREIADILTAYTTYNSRRKPELLSPETYSLVNFREAERVVDDYRKLAERAERINSTLPPEFRDAYYQLVLHPVLACSNLNDLYATVGRNRLYAAQGRAATHELAERSRELFRQDMAISRHYNDTLAGGKWHHMMDQTHIGYTYWQQPDSNSMPTVREIELPDEAEMGVALEGSVSWWPADTGAALLPGFNPFDQRRHWIEIFNRGKTPFRYAVSAGNPCVQITEPEGTIRTEKRLWVSIDWSKAPAGTDRIPIRITGPRTVHVTVYVVVHIPPAGVRLQGFAEGNAYISMEAEHYTRAVNALPVHWQRLPDLGRTLSGMTPMPVTADPQTPGKGSPHLEYRLHLFHGGEVTVRAYLSPTLNFHSTQGLRYAVSFDDEPPQVINMHAHGTIHDWEESVSNNITIGVSNHRLSKSGRHMLKFWMVDPGVVLQKLAVETGEVKPSYLGPPESIRQPAASGK